MAMKGWLIYALISLLMWGFWGFFAKLATQHLAPKSVFIYMGVGVALIGGVAMFFLEGPGFVFTPKGAVLGILTGIAGTAGGLFFVLAMNKGKASVVVAMTALYPLITLVLSYLILREHITLKQTLGIAFALAAMVLLSG